MRPNDTAADHRTTGRGADQVTVEGSERSGPVPWPRMCVAACRDRLYRIDRGVTRGVAAWRSPWARRLLPAVESGAEHTKLWWAAAALLAATGGRTGRRAAVTGLAGMAVAEAFSDGVLKRLCHRARPPQELVPSQDADDRPDSSSFPSGHTAAAVAFTVGVAVLRPGAGLVCAVPATLIATERVHTGAHYPSDVVAGAAVGLASAWLIRRTSRRPVQRVR
ncbi:phosphatase PAP2 family protein [Streptomyces sp. DT171]|uniref:phosphatase PAP2 family protein n=1 Tax=Streptomyces sp. DT171 TaxID=3416524 RepID=UPI003CF3D559